MYDFAKRPLWILSHVLVVIGVLAMIRLGFWQMSRWHSEQAALDGIEAGLDAEPVALGDLLGELGDPAAPGDVDDAAKYRRVEVSGTWDTASEVLIRNRSQNGQPGGWLLTPLVRSDGTAVAVIRGWIPLELANGGAPYPGTEPPPGEALVTGVVQLTQQGGGLGPQDPPEGILDTMARVDLQRYAQQVDAALDPVWVELQESDPAQPNPPVEPVVVSLPSPSQNFSYMMQWWFFSAIAVVGYALILRKVARSKAGIGGSSDVPVDDPPEHIDA